MYSGWLRLGRSVSAARRICEVSSCLIRANGRTGFSGYAFEQFSDDEYECDFESQKVKSSSLSSYLDLWNAVILSRSLAAALIICY